MTCPKCKGEKQYKDGTCAYCSGAWPRKPQAIEPAWKHTLKTAIINNGVLLAILTALLFLIWVLYD